MLDTKKVHRARTELLETGGVSEPLSRVVRPEILASWRRSLAFGALPNVASLPYADDLAAASRLFDAAEPVLRPLAERLAGLNAGVLLSDRHANIVERWVTDSSIRSLLDRICSAAGFGAPEVCVGTNGIGTVAELGRPALIQGPEHFADALVPFTCVGAPVYGPTSRRLEGIITLSCRAEAANALLTPLMMSAAADIEHRLLEATIMDERRLLDAYLAADTKHRLVAAVGKDVVIAATRASHLLDQLVDRDALWDVVSEQLGAPGARLQLLPTNDGGEIGLTVVSVRDGDRLIGAVVALDEAPHAASETPGKRRQPKRPLLPAIRLPGANPKWVTALETAGRYARDRMHVVVTGEPGVGKWTLVRAMIDSQGTSDGAVTIDCRHLTGDDELDGELPTPSADVIVLRHVDALSDVAARTLGSWIERALGRDSPWILATCACAAESMGLAQRLLVERFSGVVLRLPALHERPDDIQAVVVDLVAKHSRGRDVHLAPDAVRALGRTSWPGNIRQLEDVIRSLLASRVGEVTAADLPGDVRSRARRRWLSPLEQLKCEAIVDALQASDGNKARAARMIGLSRSTMYRKIRAYGIEGDAR